MKGLKKRKSAYQKGHIAEWLAALALMTKGYRIVALRYKTKLGEIDLIARKKNLVAIIEVKARNTEIMAVDAVTATAKRRIRDATDLWLTKQPDYAHLSIRFDIVAVRPWSWPLHLKDAF